MERPADAHESPPAPAGAHGLPADARGSPPAPDGAPEPPSDEASDAETAKRRADRLEALRALTGTQDGQFATAQAHEEGLSRAALAALRERGEIVCVRRRVWRFRAAPADADPAVSAYLACWPHAVISHESAACHHGLTRVRSPAQPVITVPAALRLQPAGITVHRTRHLPGVDVVKVGGVRYTSLARTVCDLGDPADPWECLALLDAAVALGASPTWIHQRATALANGRAVVALLRDATRPGAADVFRSWLERAAAHVYRVAALPDPEWNVRAYDDEGLIGIVDALWLPWRVVSEKEGTSGSTPARGSDARTRDASTGSATPGTPRAVSPGKTSSSARSTSPGRCSTPCVRRGPTSTLPASPATSTCLGGRSAERLAGAPPGGVEDKAGYGLPSAPHLVGSGL